MSDNVLGFSTEPASNTEFVPVVRYDAKAGRMSRMERVEGVNGWETTRIFIPSDQFKALADFENVEVGPVNFNTGGAPSFLMVRRDLLVAEKIAMPERPDANYKPGIRFMLKLSKDCAGDGKPVREIASNARAFLSEIAVVIKQYLDEKAQNPGKLPVLALDGDPYPVKSGSGTKSSTNFHPKFKIIGWAPRGDLVYIPKTLKAMEQSTSVKGATVNGANNGAKQSDDWDVAPSTGAQRAEAPKQKPAQTVSADDFG